MGKKVGKIEKNSTCGPNMLPYYCQRFKTSTLKVLTKMLYRASF